MEIQLEAREPHTIQSYSDTAVTVNHEIYSKSLIISRDTIISDWPVTQAADFNTQILGALIALKPEMIILGSHNPGALRCLDSIRRLCEQKIGVECMDIGAACRTFNVLLSEERDVVAGLIFTHQ
ncbi:MAG: MTH938/NDUFAF3 family protein [Legionellaceae bacterium]|nr:MTH938/NDUFAF3 family protein [Legionellaceae bacterium]